MISFGFMGTPQFSTIVLDHLEAAGFLPAFVVTQPDRPCGRGRKMTPSPVALWAGERGIETLKPDSCRQESFIEGLGKRAPQFMITAAFGQILPPEVLSIPEQGCLNIHASLLPRYRGASPIQTALLMGESRTGVTLMRMDAGLDTGPLLAQEEMEIPREMNAGELNMALAHLGGQLMARHLEDFAAGRLTEEEQDEDKATLTRILRKADGEIRFDRPADAVHNQIRAMNPWPGAFGFLQGKRYKFLRARVYPHPLAPGQAGELILEDRRMLVLCGQGAVEILEIQPESGSPMLCIDCSHNFVEGAVFSACSTAD